MDKRCKSYEQKTTLLKVRVQEIGQVFLAITPRKITTQYIQNCIKKEISKYRQLYQKETQKTQNKKVFKNQNIPPLDYIIDRHNNLLTNLEDTANEIHIQ